MLVLTRKEGEELWMNQGDIKVHILDVKNGNVRVGIEAPRSVDVLRKELVHKR